MTIPTPVRSLQAVAVWAKYSQVLQTIILSVSIYMVELQRQSSIGRNFRPSTFLTLRLLVIRIIKSACSCRFWRKLHEATEGLAPSYSGFADRRVTIFATWPYGD